jgi:ASC-1-like (ASCH) protein
MKALSIKQAFAELIVSGKKQIELRTWNTNFRGKFFIHSSLKADKKAMEKFAFDNLPCGKIIGTCELIDVKKYESEKDFLEDKNKHLSNSFSKYGFVLKNPKRIKEINVKGKLGFWNFD